jgi:serine phosphatase RsbU (regulator of sigma subunit)/integral membrane sensor domain MASE1
LFGLVAVLYAAGSELAFQSFNSAPAFGFPPAGITVSAMLLTRRRRWPAIVAAIVVSEVSVDLQHRLAIPVILASVAANSVEPLIGASLVSRWCGGRPDLTSRGGLLRFILGAVTVGPLVAGAIGATGILVASGGWWPGHVLQWWAGDGIAVLVIGAPILLWVQHQVERSRWLELCCLVVVTAALSIAAFRYGDPTALLFLPLLGWAAFRLGDLGVVLTGAAFACVANYMTAAGYGELTHMGLSSPASLVVTQAYIAVAVLLAWLLAQEVSARATAVSRGEFERNRRMAADAMRAAAELGIVLADAATMREVGQRASAAVRTRVRADRVVIKLLSADGTRFEPLAGQGLEAQSAVLDEEWTIDADAPGPRAVRDREAVYVPDWDSVGLRFADALKLVDTLRLRAAAHLPLLTEVGALGYLGIWWKEPHENDAADGQFLLAMAETTSRALERAGLREAEQREQARIGSLSELTRLLAAALTADAIGEVVGDRVCAAVGDADGVWLGIVTSDGKKLRQITATGPAEQMPHYLSVDAVKHAAKVFRTGKALIMPTALTWPLRVGPSTVGAISLVWRRPQSFSQGQVDFVAAVADLLAQALVRARLYDDEHAIATLLQRAIRPKAAAELPGLEAGSCYRQAGDVGSIGGDWYDAVALPRGGAFLSVGDVEGHGIAATQDMTQLRNASRALAVAGFQPASLLRELGRVASSMTVGQFATAAVIISDESGSELAYASAGHPPMLIRRAVSGAVDVLAEAPGPALGRFDEAVYSQGATTLARGDIVLMYTDGLIERPGEDLQLGIRRLINELRAWNPAAPLDELCERLVATLAAHQLDDICVLAVRRSADVDPL